MDELKAFVAKGAEELKGKDIPNEVKKRTLVAQTNEYIANHQGIDLDDIAVELLVEGVVQDGSK